jgi:hypothetical protein
LIDVWPATKSQAAQINRKAATGERTASSATRIGNRRQRASRAEENQDKAP